MKREVISIAFSALLAVSLFAALPTVDPATVSVTQGADRLVTVGYTLSDASAVVTVDFLTNGVSIGEANFTELGGDVNKVVKTGVRKIYWRPDRTWEGNFVEGTISAKVTAWSLAAPPDILVVENTMLQSQCELKFYVSTNALPSGGLANRYLYGVTNLVMRKVHSAGRSFRVGCPTYLYPSGTGREPPYTASFSYDYYLGIYELTHGQYTFFTSYNSFTDAQALKPLVNLGYSGLRGSDIGLDWPTNRAGCTAHSVDSTSIIGKLRTLTGLQGLDLPTECEWEYAARAGTWHNLYEIDGLSPFDVISNPPTASQTEFAEKIGWSSYNSNGAVHDVGTLPPNAFGFYDMLGNAFEYVLDRFAANTDKTDGSHVNDNMGPTTGDSASAKGGCYTSALNDCRVWSCSPVGRTSVSTVCGVRLCCGADLLYLGED